MNPVFIGANCKEQPVLSNGGRVYLTYIVQYIAQMNDGLVYCAGCKMVEVITS